MKREYQAALCLLLLLGSGAWLATTLAQRNAPFNVQETQRELEILEGILSTTLKYASGESDRDRRGGLLTWGRSREVESFYLYGQGAVFIIPNSRFGHSSRVEELSEISNLIDEVEEQGSTTDTYLRTLERRIVLTSRNLSFGRFEGFEFMPPEDPLAALSPVAPSPPAPPAPPASEGPVATERAYSDMVRAYALASGQRGKEVSGQELDEWIQKIRSNLQQRRDESQKLEKDVLEREQKIQDALVSALAQHGDSLSAIGSNEYISLIFSGGSAGFEAVLDSRGSRRALVVSIQMSQLAEFKRGGMTLNQLREKLVQYEM